MSDQKGKKRKIRNDLAVQPAIIAPLLLWKQLPSCGQKLIVLDDAGVEVRSPPISKQSPNGPTVLV
jgi:hypothetical protein